MKPCPFTDPRYTPKPKREKMTLTPAEIAGLDAGELNLSDLMAAKIAARAPTETKKGKPEEVLQIAIAKHLRMAIAPARCVNADGVMWLAIEQASGRKSPQRNAKTGKTFDVRGQKNRAKGVRSGVPDLKFWWPNGRGWIELKAGKNDTSDNQDEMHAELRKAGDLVEVCWSLDQVLATLQTWGVPLRSRISA